MYTNVVVPFLQKPYCGHYVQLPSKTNINEGWNHYTFGKRSSDMICQAIFPIPNWFSLTSPQII